MKDMIRHRITPTRSNPSKSQFPSSNVTNTNLLYDYAKY
jgi:hypothetical protein